MTTLQVPPPVEQAAEDEVRQEAVAGAAWLPRPEPDKPTRLKFTRPLVQAMAEAGLLDGINCELIDGDLIEMPAKTNDHCIGVENVNAWLVTNFVGRFRVRPESPIVVSDTNEPEPDFSVIPLDSDRTRHPTSALLVVEVSVTSSAYDRRKQSKYAAVAVPEYWILHVLNRKLEIYRRPLEREQGVWAYGELQTYGEDDTVAPLIDETKAIKVADLLP